MELKIIKERLMMAGIRPSKGLGQNFLISKPVYEKIIAAGEIKRGEIVVEIGPGVGTLTDCLADMGAQILAIEKDELLADFLTKHFESNKNIKITTGDVLRVDPSNYDLREKNYKIIANIPYYITSRLLKTIFEEWPKPSLIVLLVQKEVAQRLVVKTPHLNILALSVQYFAAPSIVSYVSRHNFFPAPKVDSAIIKLVTSDKRPETREKTRQFFKCVKIGFSSKRKKLSNNLVSGFKLTKVQIEQALTSTVGNANLRAENLSIEQWKKLTEKLLAGSR